MTSSGPAPRLAYDDLVSPREMRADCEAVGRTLGLERAATTAVERQARSLHFEDYPREIPKRDIRISEAAARLANALHLHLD